MEERPAGTVATAPTADDDPPLVLPPHPPPGLFYHQTNYGTYVVQVPKDQIYRVPPPENAAIANRYRTPVPSPADQNYKKRSCWKSSRFWCTLLYCSGTLLAIALALYIAYVVVNPKNPEFTVLQVLARPPPPSSSSSSSSSSSQREFLISLEATNPNKRLGVYYNRGGETTLLFNHKTIGTGKFLRGRLYQEEKNSTVVRVALKSSALPREIKRSVSDDTKGREAEVAMSLTVEVPVRMKIGAVKTWWMDTSVTCTFRVRALGKEGRVTSQQCQTSVKS